MAHHMIKKEQARVTPDQELTGVEMMVVATTSSVLGGLCILHLPQIMVQGESDMLTTQLSWFRYLSQQGTKTYDLVKRVLSLPYRKPDLKSVCLDPFGIPIQTPQRPFSHLMKCLSSALETITKNKDMVALFSFTNKKEKEFISALGCIQPFLPKLISQLYNCSIFALRSELLKKFESSYSVVTALLEANSKRAVKGMYRTVFHKERQYWSYILRQHHVTHARTIINSATLEIMLSGAWCPTLIAQEFRDQAYAPLGLGRPMGVTCPSWTDQLGSVAASHGASLTMIKRHFTTIFPRLDPNNDPVTVLSPPTFKPVKGTRTSTRLSNVEPLSDIKNPAVAKL